MNTRASNFIPVAMIGFLFLVVLTFGLNQLSPLELPSPSIPKWKPLPHAEERHGADANIAREIVQQRGRFCKFNCTDGFERYVCKGPGGSWAVVVMQGLKEITAFMTTDGKYTSGIIDSCKPEWNVAHP